jgi:hypothetical protein
MSDYEQIFHKQELYDMLSSGEPKPLGDLYSIEDVALNIKKIQEEVDFLKGYKKKRQQEIDAKINSLNSKVEFFRKVVVQTLQEYREKSVDFPGSCKVVTRKQSSSWSIVDEEEFINTISKAEEDGEDVDGVVEEVIEKVVRKKPAKVLLDMWEKNGNFEKYFPEEPSSCVKKIPSSVNVSFSFPKEEDDDNDFIEESIPLKSEVESAFDSL